MRQFFDDNGKVSDCSLEKGEYVIFADGAKHGCTEARWRYSNQAFVSFYDKDGVDREEPIYSNEVIKIERKKREYKKQTDISKMKQIFPCGESKKSYQVEDGTNGCITRGNRREYYKYYAKSICVVEDGKVYAPVWA